MKRSHYNFCIECRKGFELINNPDYCESCRIKLDISPGEYQDYEKDSLDSWDKLTNIIKEIGYGGIS
jgi:predicted amidophosphoribosyltransferase